MLKADAAAVCECSTNTADATELKRWRRCIYVAAVADEDGTADDAHSAVAVAEAETEQVATALTHAAATLSLNT